MNEKLQVLKTISLGVEAEAERGGYTSLSAVIKLFRQCWGGIVHGPLKSPRRQTDGSSGPSLQVFWSGAGEPWKGQRFPETML